MQKTLKYLSVMLSSFILFSLVGLSGAVKTRAEATGKREITANGVYWYSDTLTSGFASGSGTESDPYIIQTAAQLRLAVTGNTKTGVFYRLGNDIAINNTASSDWFKGTGLKNWIKGRTDGKDHTDAQNKLEMSGDQFRNTFDGAGHTVSGLYLDYTGTGIAGGSYYGWGLFPYVNGATIKNLKLTDVYIKSDITDENDSHRHGYGALIGATYTKGATVSNVSVQNVTFQLNRVAQKYTATTASVNVGGIVGFAGGRITVSDAVVKNIKATLTNGYSSAKQPCRVGSIVGFVFSSQRYTLTNIISYGNMNPFSGGADEDAVTSVNPPENFETRSGSSITNVWAVGNVSVPKALGASVQIISDQSEFETVQGDFFDLLGTENLWLPLQKCKLPMLKSFAADQMTVHRSPVPGTCTKAAKCDYCGAALSTQPDMKNHTGTMVTKAKVPYTCDMIGYEGTVYCSDCGKVVSYGQSIDAIGHEYGEWTVKKTATTKEDGLKVCTCKVCGHIHEEIIPAVLPKSGSKNSNTKNTSKSGKNTNTKNDSSKKTEDEVNDTDSALEETNPSEEEESRIVEQVVTEDVENDFNIWLYFGIASGILIFATAVSVFFILKKPKKQKGVVTNEKQ